MITPLSPDGPDVRELLFLIVKASVAWAAGHRLTAKRLLLRASNEITVLRVQLQQQGEHR